MRNIVLQNDFKNTQNTRIKTKMFKFRVLYYCHLNKNLFPTKSKYKKKLIFSVHSP